MSNDVPSPIDLRDADDARQWERQALSKRPSRPRFFGAFVEEIRRHSRPIKTVLELGSGPGFLALHVLTNLPQLTYTAFDFSSVMHELARSRLGVLAERVRFVEGSFKAASWTAGLAEFDCVVTHQAVHELRHKRYAPELHSQVAKLLPTRGLYLVCDHFAGVGGMDDDELFMTQDEQRAALVIGGFEAPELVRVEDKLAMYRATR